MQARRSALFICATQPIPSGSAACVRTIGMARALRNNSWSVHCATVQRPLEHAEGEMPLPASFLPPNDPDAIASCLTESRPDVVIFDRHYIEEMFAHQVADRCPQALRVLDLQVLSLPPLYLCLPSTKHSAARTGSPLAQGRQATAGQRRGVHRRQRCAPARGCIVRPALQGACLNPPVRSHTHLLRLRGLSSHIVLLILLLL